MTTHFRKQKVNTDVLSNKNAISVPHHFLQIHGGSTQELELFGIEVIPMTMPKGEGFSRLCLRETFWIFTLDTMSPDGLNEELEINTLI